MKKIFIVFVVLASSAGIGLGLGWVADRYLIPEPVKYGAAKKSPAPSPTAAAEKFVWGVQGGAFVLNTLADPYQPENVKKQIKSVKDLGANLIRANLELKKSESGAPFSLTPRQEINDDFISRVSSSGLDILLVIDPDVPSTIGKVNYEKSGYDLASYAARRYKGKVKYYQIVNEVSGTIVKPEKYDGATFEGENGIHYSVERYRATLGWIKGMSRGIRENDPGAKILLSGHWILYDIFGKLIQDGADFDLIGWAYYSPDGDDPTRREFNNGDYMNLAEKLARYGKPLWIVEANSDHGSYFDGTKTPAQGEKEQAAYIKTLAENVCNSGYFRGFIFFTLTDNPTADEAGNEQDAHMGLVEVKKEGNKNKITREKPAFSAYRKIIAENPSPKNHSTNNSM